MTQTHVELSVAHLMVELQELYIFLNDFSYLLRDCFHLLFMRKIIKNKFT